MVRHDLGYMDKCPLCSRHQILVQPRKNWKAPELYPEPDCLYGYDKIQQDRRRNHKKYQDVVKIIDHWCFQSGLTTMDSVMLILKVVLEYATEQASKEIKRS